jgi:serine/threonine protein phosphatase PrpC
MKIKKMLPIKRQNSLHTFIDCKSILELKMCPNINKNPFAHKKSMDLPYHTNQYFENKEKSRKASCHSKIILKPIIKEKSEYSMKVTNSPLLFRQDNFKLKQKIKHSSKSGITLPFYMRSKFQNDKIMCINKEKKNSSDKTLSLYIDRELEEEEEEKNNKLNEKLIKIDIIYKNENCISATQKGFLAKKNIEKENNQDCSLIIENVCGIKNYNIYSIMDGHGSNGHLVSNFIKDNIIKYFSDISFYFKKIKPKEKTSIIYPENILDLIYKKLKKNDYQKIKDFYKEVDELLSSIEVHFDSNFSGSTCIIIFQIGNKIISSNVGDSRALLIKENKEIIELSHDQKPDNENEKKRIEEMGGIVSQCNDLYDDGKEGGPFRIWMKGCDYPGIAMSRSIGDKIAHSIGVINEPEIIEFNLDELSKFIILGSDGVFQHLNNNEINDIIFEEKEKIGENICKKIINKAINKFIENDEYVVDDITISFISK